MAGKIKKIVVILLAVCLVGVLIVHITLMFYFKQHFMWGTTINGMDVSKLTVEEAKNMLEAGGEKYHLKLNARLGKSEEIWGDEIGFRYEVVQDLETLKRKQNYFVWEWMKGMERQFEVDIISQFDEDTLKERCNQLNCADEAQMINPEDAYIMYRAGTYEVVEEKVGTLLDKEILEAGIKEAIEAEKESLDIEELGCYEEAKVKSNDALLVCMAHKINSYCDKEITYVLGDQKEQISASTLRGWLKLVDQEDAKVTSTLPNTLSYELLSQKEIKIDEEAVKCYIEELAKKYDTLHKKRMFTTSKNVLVEVPAGDYGWEIDEMQENRALLSLLQSNEKQITRTPIFAQEAYNTISDDIGKSYVEVDLTGQHLWFYKEGKLITEGDIVSGMGTNKHATPAGVFSIDYKQRKAILRGPGYACPVSYWMPFYDGMGIHDATWRGKFGGTIYMYDGSHGCINSPLSLAGAIYEEMESGMPIICYH